MNTLERPKMQILNNPNNEDCSQRWMSCLRWKISLTVWIAKSCSQSLFRKLGHPMKVMTETCFLALSSSQFHVLHCPQSPIFCPVACSLTCPPCLSAGWRGAGRAACPSGRFVCLHHGPCFFLGLLVFWPCALQLAAQTDGFVGCCLLGL